MSLLILSVRVSITSQSRAEEMVKDMMVKFDGSVKVIKEAPQESPGVGKTSSPNGDLLQEHLGASMHKGSINASKSHHHILCILQCARDCDKSNIRDEDK
ncbi:hypothetical protein AMTR_s00085p00170850 [Amborella trichopoda]|uniref:Uncharacterized protein n=1 Tax=Amborella trichopoda TaxID=13333 RepID=W1P6Y8_AMBTC|nr:hypothetical protein AMTR_s00085p00170850 [Amborella trichopoda]